MNSIVLGPHLKYSSCIFKDASTTSTEAEADMLELYIERSQLKDGLSLLDLGCGWGSPVSSWLADFLAARLQLCQSLPHRGSK
jgi:cyclopropane-fatty-acyl-phospholipid synthase